MLRGGGKCSSVTPPIFRAFRLSVKFPVIRRSSSLSPLNRRELGCYHGDKGSDGHDCVRYVCWSNMKVALSGIPMRKGKWIIPHLKIMPHGHKHSSCYIYSSSVEWIAQNGNLDTLRLLACFVYAHFVHASREAWRYFLHIFLVCYTTRPLKLARYNLRIFLSSFYSCFSHPSPCLEEPHTSVLSGW